MASTVDFTPLQNDEERKSNTDKSTDNTPRGNYYNMTHRNI